MAIETKDPHVASLQQLLEYKLQAEDAENFGTNDLRLLVRKGFKQEQHLRQATVDMLQGPPGAAVKSFLISVLLTAFNPAALQQGSMTSAKHTALLLFLLQFSFLASLLFAASTSSTCFGFAEPKTEKAATELLEGESTSYGPIDRAVL